MAECKAASPVSPDCCFAFFIIRSTQACLAFLIEVFYTSGWHHHSLWSQWSFSKGQQLSLLLLQAASFLQMGGPTHQSDKGTHLFPLFPPSCSTLWRMIPLLFIPMKTNTKHELLRARAEQNILILNPSWIIPVGLPPKWITLLPMYCRRRCYSLSPGVQRVEEGECNISVDEKNPSHWYLVLWARRDQPELRYVWAAQNCTFPLIWWSKISPQRDTEKYVECRREREREAMSRRREAGVACPII